MANEKPSGPGTFCWNELMTRDVPAATNFYTKLLGWTIEEMDMGEMGTYTMFKRGDDTVGGMMAMPSDMPEQVPPHWMTYVQVDDVDASFGQAKELGATGQVPPMDIPNIGRFAVITDPTGATIALYQEAAQQA
ncbi:MAG: VOC family protein [Acidobacteriota bacterium]